MNAEVNTSSIIPQCPSEVYGQRQTSQAIKSESPNLFLMARMAVTVGLFGLVPADPSLS